MLAFPATPFSDQMIFWPSYTQHPFPRRTKHIRMQNISLSNRARRCTRVHRKSSLFAYPLGRGYSHGITVICSTGAETRRSAREPGYF